MGVVGKDFLGTRHIGRGAFEFDGIGAQVNGKVQAVFQHMQIFIARTEQGLNVGADLDAFLHAVSGRPPWELLLDAGSQNGATDFVQRKAE